MTKANKNKTESRRQLKPAMKWQTDEYNRSIEFKATLPYPFLLLCRIVGITPRQVLLDFMDNLACGSWKREGRDDIRSKAIEYFLLHQYGRNYYSVEQIKEIFKEMDAIGMLYPNTDNEKIIDLHVKWRKKYQKYWFKKWFYFNDRH